MDRRDMLAVDIATHAATRLILDSIDRQGLEKTLQDMREHCPKTKLDEVNPSSLSVWRGFLAVLDKMHDIIESKIPSKDTDKPDWDLKIPDGI